jgi:DNA modification methylase
MKPYYQDDKCTIYLGDCREILPTIGTFDLLLTDPPYGINAGDQRRQKSRTKLALAKDYGVNDWDKSPVPDWTLSLAREICSKQIIFGGNYYALPPSRCWFVWDKENSGDFADCELAWTNLDKSVRLKKHLWNGMIRKGQEQRFHPTQKPLEVMSWALGHAGEVKTVLDPWMGSGTTLRACKDVGIKCVGIEREEKYCEIAVQRLAQECLALG